MSVKRVEVVVSRQRKALSFPLQSCDSWMVVKENPDRKKNQKNPPQQIAPQTLHNKWSFPLRIFSVNVTKSEISSGFGHIYWKYPNEKLHFFVQWNIYFSVFVFQLVTLNALKNIDFAMELKILRFRKHWLNSGTMVLYMLN